MKHKNGDIWIGSFTIDDELVGVWFKMINGAWIIHRDGHELAIIFLDTSGGYVYNGILISSYGKPITQRCLDVIAYVNSQSIRYSGTIIDLGPKNE